MIWYRNSIAASVVSLFGCCLILGGICLFPEGEIFGGISILAVGIGCAIWGKKISDDKAFKTWWKQVEDANLQGAIAQNANLAIQIYNKNPQERTLKKLETLNPGAVQYIRANIGKK